MKQQSEVEMENAEVLAEKEGEFRTHRVVRIEEDYYDVDENGGRNGAWDSRSPEGKTKVRAIDRTEARRILLEMGESLENAARKTR